MHDGRHYVVRNVQQQFRPDVVSLSEERHVVLLKEVEEVGKRNRKSDDPHRSRKEVEKLVANPGVKYHQSKTSQRDNHNKRIGLRQKQHRIDKVLNDARTF